MKSQPHPEGFRKVTMLLPAQLLDDAMQEMEASLTETVRICLEESIRRRAYDRLLAAYGTFDPQIDLAALRED